MKSPRINSKICREVTKRPSKTQSAARQRNTTFGKVLDEALK